ncbi:MAG: hypothetical protein KKG04_07515 [Candidatus Thermoplasmatota archaeon]|nr:hypothetical protein [Candidatus Thermoplasmatota archaeon]
MIIFIYLLTIAALLSSYRLFIGPTIQDRIISLSCITVILIINLVILSIHYSVAYYLDIAIAFLLLDFVGTIVLTKYLSQEKI